MVEPSSSRAFAVKAGASGTLPRRPGSPNGAPTSGCRHRLPVGSLAAIERLRRERLTGPAIARALGLARSAVGAVLRRLGLGRLSALEPTPPAIRYELGPLSPEVARRLALQQLAEMSQGRDPNAERRREQVEGLSLRAAFERFFAA